MATAKLYDHPLSNNSAFKQRLADDAANRQKLEDAVHEIDGDIALLYSIYADVASTEECPAEQTVQGLQPIQARLRRNANALLALL